MVHGRIRTTTAKAKELRRYADRVITLGKRVSLSDLDGLEGEELTTAKASRLHAIRQAANWVHDKDALNMVFGEYSERFKARPGGYTRIYKAGFRNGDNAPLSYIELVSEEYVAGESDSETSVSEDAPEAAQSEE